MMNKNKIIFGIVAILVVAGAVAWYMNFYKNQIRSKSFVGQIQEVKDDRIILKGVYEIPDHKELESKDRVDVGIIITPDTKFTKTLLYYPTKEELAKTNGMYKPAELKQENVGGSLADLKTGVVDGFYAYSNKNVYGDKEFKASEIKYIWTVYPEENK